MPCWHLPYLRRSNREQALLCAKFEVVETYALVTGILVIHDAERKDGSISGVLEKATEVSAKLLLR